MGNRKLPKTGDGTIVESWLAWLRALTPRVSSAFADLELLEEQHTARVLDAFHAVGLAQHHFAPSTGYGYHDLGREALEKAVAALWGAEAALVRQQIVSGTQAIHLCLQALAVPGREVVFVGEPYETLQVAVGLRGNEPASLAQKGIRLRVIELASSQTTWLQAIVASVMSDTGLIYLQRSAGYSARPALSVHEIARIVSHVKQKNAEILIFVDNCYGEFVEDREPTQAGADLMAGSLIKNPGGGLAPGGAYIAGRRELVQCVAAHLFSPGLGGDIGPNLISPRLFFQGLFNGPHLVGQALRGAILCARAFAELGYETNPAWDEPRADLVQRIVFGNAESLLRFCRAVQAASPVEAHVRPEPALLPGYLDRIIMAGGTFIQGSSSELTIDAPLRPPFIGYWQGGTTFHHARLALAHGLASIIDRPTIIRM